MSPTDREIKNLEQEIYTMLPTDSGTVGSRLEVAATIARKAAKIGAVPRFPRCAPREPDGWTLDYKFLESVREKCEQISGESPSLEGVEGVLLGAEIVLGSEPRVRSMHFEDGAVELVLEPNQAIGALIHALRKFVGPKEEAPNFRGVDVTIGHTGEEYRVIVMRPGGKTPLELLTERDERIEELERERIEVQNASRVLTCAFCGHAYPPGTPPSNHEALAAHIETCEKHPARKIVEQRDRLVEAVSAVYYAACWKADRDVDERALWTELRDAAGFEPGNSPKPIVANVRK